MTTKDEILEAIKLTTTANNGAPLGKGSFEQKTGIKETQWRGLYWARWGDALIEAGFNPNTVPERIDESVIFDKLIPAIRYYKKLPTKPELQIYRRTIDKDFPSLTTIEKRFRSRANLYIALAQYINGKPEYDDVTILCEQFTTEEAESIEKLSEGLVYLLKSGEHYKIGKTSNLERRVKEITVAMPESISIIHSISTDDADGIEAYWHRRFSDRRLNGEWFKLTVSDVAAFKRRKFQ